MSVFQGGGPTLDVTPKKLQSQKSRRFEKIVTVKLKNAKKRVLKSPVQMAFWTFFEKYKYLYFLVLDDIHSMKISRTCVFKP